MSNQETKAVLYEVKKELEATEHYFKSGIKELRDIHHKNKSMFSALIKKVHTCIGMFERKGALPSMLENDPECLVDALDSDFDFSYTDYEDIPHDLKKTLHEFEKSLNDYCLELQGKARKSRKRFEDEMLMEVESLKHDIHYYLNEKQTWPEELQEWKNKHLTNLSRLKAKLDAKIDSSKQKANQFKKEMDEAYETLQSTLDQLKSSKGKLLNH